MKRIFYLPVICLSFAALADDGVDTAVETNLVIVSNEKVVRGLTRQALLDGGNGKVIDASGTVASYAEVVALNVTATNIHQVSDAIHKGVTIGMQDLWDVTNQIPEHATHIALCLPSPSAPQNLMGEVISAGSDGVVDWQIVRYTQKLLIAPNRHIEYRYLSTTATVACVWDEWDKDALEHRCTFVRPVAMRGKLIRSYDHDIIGGAKGFDFGSALVTVDGKPTFTGVWTNSVTGAIYEFKNGSILKQIIQELEE